MNLRHFVFSDAEYRLLAVGAYSFAAFSIAALVQILSSGNVDPVVHPHLARVAFTAMPLLAAGLSLDFYCVGRPRMHWLAALLCMAIGALISISSSSMGVVLGVYSSAVAQYMNYGLWTAVALVLLAGISSWLVGRRATESDDRAMDGAD